MDEQDHESSTSQDLLKDLEQLKMDNDINKFDELTGLKAPTAKHTSNSIDDNEMEESEGVGYIKDQPKKPHTEGSDLYLPEGNSNKNLLQEDNVHFDPKNFSETKLEENEVYNPKKAEEQEKDNVHNKEGDILQELNMEDGEHRDVHEENKGASGISEENWHVPPSYSDVRQDSEAVLQQKLEEIEGKEDEKVEKDKRLMDDKVQWRSQSRENNRKPENVGHGKPRSGRQRPGLDRPYGGHERQSHDRKDRERRQHAQNHWVEYKPDQERYSAAQHEREKPKGDRKQKNEEKKFRDSGLPDERHKYEYFWGNRFVFSQWYQCKFEIDGKIYNCAEQYMMHQKAVLMDDVERAEIIMALDDPREMKQQGRYVENFDKKKWDKHCQDVVEKGNMGKFSQNEELKEQLLGTFPRTLVEASPMDRIWGIGLAEEDHRAWNKKTWRGQNRLGEVLTRVRNNIMEDQKMGRMGGKGPIKETVNEGEQKVGRQGGKGPGKEKTKKEEQEEGRMGKGGPVKETVNKVEQKVGSQEGRKGKKSPVKGRASENCRSTPV